MKDDGAGSYHRIAFQAAGLNMLHLEPDPHGCFCVTAFKSFFGGLGEDFSIHCEACAKKSPTEVIEQNRMRLVK